MCDLLAGTRKTVLRRLVLCVYVVRVDWPTVLDICAALSQVLLLWYLSAAVAIVQGRLSQKTKPGLFVSPSGSHLDEARAENRTSSF